MDQNCEFSEEDSNLGQFRYKCKCGKCKAAIHFAPFAIVEGVKEPGGPVLRQFVPFIMPMAISSVDISGKSVSDPEGKITLKLIDKDPVSYGLADFFASAQPVRGIFYAEADVMTWDIPEGYFEEATAKMKSELSQRNLTLVKSGIVLHTSLNDEFGSLLCRSSVIGTEGEIVPVQSPDFVREYENVERFAKMHALGKVLGIDAGDLRGVLGSILESISQAAEEAYQEESPPESLPKTPSGATLH